MITRLFLTGGAVGLQRQIFAAINAFGHPGEDIQGHFSYVHTKHRILPLIAAGQYVEPRVGCIFFDHSLEIGDRVEVNESQSFELLKYRIGDDLLQRFEVPTIGLKYVFRVELIDVLRLPACFDCNSRRPCVMSGEKGAFCKRPQGPIGDLHVLLMKFGCRGHLHSSVDNRRYRYPSSKRADPLPETIGFISTACKIADRECPKKQKDEQHSRHSERNVPAQPIASIASSFHVLPPLASAWTIGDSERLLQWGRA